MVGCVRVRGGVCEVVGCVRVVGWWGTHLSLRLWWSPGEPM